VALDVAFQLDVEHDPDTGTYQHADALAALQEILSVRRPGFTMVELCGDRWSGKTTLLKDFADIAVQAGWRLAAGSAAATRVPFAAFVDALNEPLCRMTAELDVLRDSGHQPWLGEIFPALLCPTQSARPIAPGKMYHIFHAIRGLIETLTTIGDQLLLLDDMHWADPSSIGVLEYLLRYPPDGSVVVVIAHRPRQGGQVLSGVMSAATATGVGRRIR